VNDSPDRRPPLVVAAEWTSRITAISLEMVLPGLIGFWIGRLLGSLFWAIVLLVLGGILGMTTAIIHLVRLTSTTGTAKPARRTPPEGKSSEKSPKSKSSEKNSREGESSPKT
jgi:hypothetical protein